jgi:hypothetical protein
MSLRIVLDTTVIRSSKRRRCDRSNSLILTRLHRQKASSLGLAPLTAFLSEAPKHFAYAWARFLAVPVRSFLRFKKFSPPRFDLPLSLGFYRPFQIPEGIRIG